MNVQGVIPPPAVWTCSVSSHHQQYGRAGCLSTTSSMDVQGVSLPPAEWTCRVSLYHQQYGLAGCLSTTSRMRAGCLFTTRCMHVQGVFPTPVRTCRVSIHHQQNGRAGYLSTTSSMNVQGVRLFFPVCYTLHPGIYSFFKCRNARLFGIPVSVVPVRYQYRNAPGTG